MHALKTSVLLAALGVAVLTAPGRAADLLDTPYQDVPEVVPVEVGSGWYLRGDVSYDFKSDLDADYRRYHQTKAAEYDAFGKVKSPAEFGYADGRYDDMEIDDAINGGIGIGYQFTDYFRGDVTGHYWQADVDGHDHWNAVCDGSDSAGNAFPKGSTCRSDDHAEVQAIEVMANAYVDLGTYVGLTPYVGAGAGAVHLDYDHLSKTTTCVDDGGDCGKASNVGTSFGGEDSWRFAYALMAGASYDLTRNLKVDLGYRYVNVDDGDMFDFDTISKGNGASGVEGRDDGFDRHTVQVGLRYALF